MFPGIKSCRGHCPVVICRCPDRPTGPWTTAFSRPVRSSLHPAESCDRVAGQGPARDWLRAGQGADQPGGEAIQHGPVTEPVALLNAGTGADHRLGPDHAAVAADLPARDQDDPGRSPAIGDGPFCDKVRVRGASAPTAYGCLLLSFARDVPHDWGELGHQLEDFEVVNGASAVLDLVP